MPPSRPALTREAWTSAALAMCAEQGFAKVAVEPLAVRLGATKGSFYWHFANRDDLLTGMLAEWERRHTHAIIESLDAAPPGTRLDTLLTNVFGEPGEHPAEQAIFAAAAHPLVGPVVARVHEARIGYVAGLLRDRGLTARRARARARIAYAAYLGTMQLRGDGVVDAAGAETLIAETLAMVTAP